MKKKLLAVALVVMSSIAMVNLAACGGDKAKSLSQQICDKASACNLLSGVTVSECVSTINLCLNTLTAAQHADWDTAIKGCVALQACANFATCYASVPYC
ncbi:MAG TPA: hypothetical protein VH880_07655 [Anaeromyxobacteraceae bacterium]|jgi:hypothetical protein